ncbi:hypothetical protein IEQ34_016842 [Dendrobium chrysotoxum]|uniref:Uncharacterized protein n=1 Tax=Dendrobium chrysotoxum TaxID=161865 RepID=A0AAV7GGQ4_DENCH|nr:hypothetical protein IEQ34_016842 [Dendrobium chrysotoxum]
MLLHKNFHIPNDMVTTVPKRSDRASLPPPGYLTISETSLRAGLRFPPSAELVEILRRCGVCLSQFSYRAMSVIVGLIALFRDRGAVLTPEHLSRMDGLPATCRGWGKMRDLPAPLHVGEEDLMRLLKVPNVEHLLYEVRYLNKYIEEEFLFKVGLSFHYGRSDARMLKPTSKVLLKKKKLEGVVANTSKLAPVSSPVKIRVPGDVLNHQCVGRRKTDDLLSRRTELEAELTGALNEWNVEFVKIKYLQGEFKRKAQATITQLSEDQRASGEKVAVLEAENKRSQTLIAEKEAALTSFESARVIDDFKKSIAFKIIIQDHVQDARDHIYEVEVKALEQQCLDDGFIRGFLKGVRLMQRKTGVGVEGLTPSQASDDFPPGSDGDEIESDLQKAFALEADDEVVDIE